MDSTAVIRSITRTPDLEADLKRARWFANWMDAKFSVMGIRFGIDHVVSLVPVVGDTAAVLAGIYPIYIAERHKLGLPVQAKMAGNLFLEWVIGLTPFLGDLGDVWFKANIRNLKLLEKAAVQARG